MPKKEEETPEQKRSFKVFEKRKRLKKFEESPPKKRKQLYKIQLKFLFLKKESPQIFAETLKKRKRPNRIKFKQYFLKHLKETPQL